MGTVYDKPDPETLGIVNEVLDGYHPRLVEIDVDIRVLMAYGPRRGEKLERPAMMSRGCRIYGKARILQLRDRAAGMGDCQIILDGDAWEAFNIQQRRALVDHELTHFEPVHDRDGSPKTDDQGRPKLRIRHHDYEVGGFHEIAERYQSDSLEVAAVGAIFRDRISGTRSTERVQLYLPGFETEDDGKVVPIKRKAG